MALSGVCAALVAASLALAPSASAAGASGDAGVGTKAALNNPDCDPATGRIRFPSIAAPLCVKPWKGGDDNGGATAQGVTKDAVKVVVLYAKVQQDARSTSTLYRNRGTGAFSNQVAGLTDENEVYAHTFETWGRKVDLVFVEGSGPDEIAQRADATKVAAMKPFAVLDAAISGGNQKSGGLVFQTDLVKKGVPLVLSSTGAPPVDPTENSKDVGALTAEFAGKALVGGKAEYAGDALEAQPRVFGVLYQGGAFDIDDFTKQFAKYGGKVAVPAAFDVPPGTSETDATTQAQAQVPTLITKMKDAGVTTIIDLLPFTYGLREGMTAATQQEYFPEWVMGSGGPAGGGSFPSDVALLMRVSDQKQAAHAFGLVYLPPNYPRDQFVVPSEWFWGTDKGNSWSGAASTLGPLYTRIMLAGPKLTAAKMKDGALPSEPIGGSFSESAITPAAGATNKDGTPARDTALAWWDPSTTGIDFATQASGQGVWQYLDGAHRYLPGDIPKSVTGFFDPSLATTVHQFDTLPAGEPVPTKYPCTGCPSSGATSPVPSSAS